MQFVYFIVDAIESAAVAGYIGYVVSCENVDIGLNVVRSSTKTSMIAILREFFIFFSFLIILYFFGLFNTAKKILRFIFPLFFRHYPLFYIRMYNVLFSHRHPLQYIFE